MLPICRLSDISASAGASCGPSSRGVTSDACQPLQVIVGTLALAHARLQMYSVVCSPVHCGHLSRLSMLVDCLPVLTAEPAWCTAATAPFSSQGLLPAIVHPAGTACS